MNTTKAKANKTKKENLESLGLPALWERFKEVTGESTRSPNKKFLVRKIEEALAARVVEPATMSIDSAPPKQRGRFASMTIEELQAKYREVVGRETGSVDRRYLEWKVREAEKGHINVGPRKTRSSDGEPLDVKILPLRLDTDAADKMDEAWRAHGIKNRTQFLRNAIGRYLTHLGARDAAALFAKTGALIA